MSPLLFSGTISRIAGGEGQAGREVSSFSEEKEAKRLLFILERSGCYHSKPNE
jgi:hypothetical protein